MAEGGWRKAEAASVADDVSRGGPPSARATDAGQLAGGLDRLERRCRFVRLGMALAGVVVAGLVTSFAGAVLFWAVIGVASIPVTERLTLRRRRDENPGSEVRMALVTGRPVRSWLTFGLPQERRIAIVSGGWIRLESIWRAETDVVLVPYDTSAAVVDALSHGPEGLDAGRRAVRVRFGRR